MPKDLRQFLKWRNFGKFGHTGYSASFRVKRKNEQLPWKNPWGRERRLLSAFCVIHFTEKKLFNPSLNVMQ